MAQPSKGGRASKKKRTPTPQEQQKHPQRWERDLNPGRMEGQNIGAPSVGSASRRKTAADVQVIAARLKDFAHDELSQIPVVEPGTKLKQGAVYIDLRSPAPVPFTAAGDIIVEKINHYAPKSEVPYEIWNRLVEALGPGAMEKSAVMNDENRPFSSQRAAQESAVEAAHPERSSRDTDSDEKIDEALAESFPASDPPSWTTGRGEKPERSSSETERDELNGLSDAELNDKAHALNIDSGPLNREQIILAIRSQLSGTEV